MMLHNTKEIATVEIKGTADSDRNIGRELGLYLVSVPLSLMVSLLYHFHARYV